MDALPQIVSYYYYYYIEDDAVSFYYIKDLYIRAYIYKMCQVDFEIVSQ